MALVEISNRLGAQHGRLAGSRRIMINLKLSPKGLFDVPKFSLQLARNCKSVGIPYMEDMFPLGRRFGKTCLEDTWL